MIKHKKGKEKEKYTHFSKPLETYTVISQFFPIEDVPYVPKGRFQKKWFTLQTK